MERVVITGAGAVSPVGSSFGEVMMAIERGEKGIGKILNFNTDLFPSNLGAEIKENGKVLRWDSSVDRKEVFIQMAVDELYKQCKWIEHYSPDNRILNLGAGLDYFNLLNYIGSDERRYGNWQKFSKSTYSIVESLTTQFRIKGGFTVNVTACVASTQAIGLSYRMLKNSQNGRVIITGGFDSMLNHLHYMGFYKLGALSSWEGPSDEACRPFDKDRCGLVLGEGAVAFLLQNTKEAYPGSILAEIAGYSSTMDAYMITDPDPEGKSLAKAAMNAIEEAEISPYDIDCVHLHGTGTEKNELAECEAMKLIFKKRYREIPVYSMKGQIGHLIGACGAMEMLGVIYSLKEQVVPPTVNFKEADPDIPLLVIKDRPMKMKIRYILKLNSAFGGQNTAFVVKKYV